MTATHFANSMLSTKHTVMAAESCHAVQQWPEVLGTWYLLELAQHQLLSTLVLKVLLA